MRSKSDDGRRSVAWRIGVKAGELAAMKKGGRKMIGRAMMTKSVRFEREELADLQRAVMRMLWAWQAHKEETEHPDADKYIERYQRLYTKIASARWGRNKA